MDKIRDAIQNGTYEVDTYAKRRQLEKFTEYYVKQPNIDEKIIQSILLLSSKRNFYASNTFYTAILNLYRNHTHIDFPDDVLISLIRVVPETLKNYLDKIKEISLNVLLNPLTMQHIDMNTLKTQIDRTNNFTEENVVHLLSTYYEKNIMYTGKNYVKMCELVMYKLNKLPDSLLSFYKQDSKYNILKHITNIIEYLDKHKYVITINDVCVVYQHGDLEAIQYVVLKSGLKITDKCIDKLLDIGNTHLFTKSDRKEIADILDFSIGFGYQPNIGHIKKACNRLHYFNNINNYGIPLEELLNLQKEVTYFPYIMRNNELVVNTLLYEVIDTRKLVSFKKLIKSYNIVPNIYCLRVACSVYNNIDIIKYIVDNFNLKLDTVCALNTLLYSGNGGNKTVGYVMSNYKMPNISVDDPPVKVVVQEQNNINVAVVNNIVLPDASTDINIRKKTAIKKEVVKELGLKTNMMTAIELQKHLLKYLKSNGLIIDKSIKINKFIAQVIGDNEKESSFINFDDITKLLHYCFIM